MAGALRFPPCREVKLEGGADVRFRFPLRAHGGVSSGQAWCGLAVGLIIPIGTTTGSHRDLDAEKPASVESPSRLRWGTWHACCSGAALASRRPLSFCIRRAY